MNRRHFIKLVTASGTAALAAEGVTPPVASGQPPVAPGCKFFTVEQAATVEAISEQLIPTDDFPGGKRAGVVYFIDRAIAGPLERLGGRYDEGLKLVNRVSQDKHGHPFASLPSYQQEAVLRSIESGEGAGVPGQDFFILIRRHTMQGYYSDPELGGNRDGSSWKMLNFNR